MQQARNEGLKPDGRFLAQFDELHSHSFIRDDVANNGPASDFPFGNRE